jgi:hypothetical protein
VTGGEDERIPLIRASEHVKTAIQILDKAGAPDDIAAHLDLAIERLLALTGRPSAGLEGANDDPDPDIAQSS